MLFLARIDFAFPFPTTHDYEAWATMKDILALGQETGVRDGSFIELDRLLGHCAKAKCSLFAGDRSD